MIPPPPGHRSSAWSILCGSSEFSYFAATSKPKAASRNVIAAEASRYLKVGQMFAVVGFDMAIPFLFVRCPSSVTRLGGCGLGQMGTAAGTLHGGCGADGSAPRDGVFLRPPARGGLGQSAEVAVEVGLVGVSADGGDLGQRARLCRDQPSGVVEAQDTGGFLGTDAELCAEDCVEMSSAPSDLIGHERDRQAAVAGRYLLPGLEQLRTRARGTARGCWAGGPPRRR